MSQTFLPCLFAVLLMLAVAVPGFLLIKRKMVSEECIPGLSKVLLYVCQPPLAVYTFLSCEFSYEKLINIAIFAGLVVLIHAVMISLSYLILRKKCIQPIYRIITLATTFSNCAFFGIPIIEALLPDKASELIVYTTVFAVIMNIIGWTVGAAIISRDTRHISVKKIFLNPATIGLAIALILYVLRVDIPQDADSMIEALARMSSPLSMIIIGMRLATVDLKRFFTNIKVYLTLAVKQIAMPLITFGLVMLLPFVDADLRQILFIVSACPVASVVLNFSEIVGSGQKEAANIVLLSTITCILTLPPMMLLLPFIS